LPPNLANAVGQEGASLEFVSEQLWTTPRTVDDKCLDKENFLFAQYTCVHPIDSMYSRYNAICAIAFTSIFSAFLFLIWTRYSLKHSRFTYIQYDMKTVTAADYTCHTKICPEKFEEWYDNVYMKGDMAKEISPAISLK
jgi:hypothetical protein